ncbi:MAG TPA: NAD(P)-binding protein [Oligoflexia bacterium]|nr:NAD(P)-binding protein [Oligoflexia bacterium]HMP49307.1 NAD(P)-binding protein [Oligoflexia bacterium]
MEFLTRRKFIKGAFTSSLLPLLPAVGTGSFSALSLKACQRKSIKTTLHGAEHDTGHLLRDKEYSFFPLSEVTEEVDILILGGGVSGLSARYFLADKSPEKSVMLLELAPETGGNARAGSGPEGGRFPWGAHYLPLPSRSNHDLIRFLEKAGAITDYDSDGSPVYNEDFLIHAPESMLHEFGEKTDGLRPKVNLRPEDKNAFRKFNSLVKKYSSYTDSKGKRAFGIPLLSESSHDSDLMALDQITGIDFLEREGIISEKVNWYVNYATRDDYGSLARDVSAWAMLHYFCARDSFLMKGAENRTLLTWPEGNSFLVESLLKAVKNERFPIKTNSLVTGIRRDENFFIAQYLSLKDKKRKMIRSKNIISALPEFVFRRLLSNELGEKFFLRPQLEYVPWLIVNLSIPKLPFNYQNIPWDSVSIHTPDLGFVRSDHQSFSPGLVPTVLTFYYPLAEEDPKVARSWLLENDPLVFTELACRRLDAMYPGLSDFVTKSDIWYWGHGMAKPRPGIISNRISEKDVLPSGLVYAHTDQSVISVFEEAFYHGKRGAEIVN